MDHNKLKQNNHTQFKQDDILATAVKSKSLVIIYLVSGIKLQGYINGFDNHVIFLTRPGTQENGIIQMVFKQAISTILMNNEFI